MSTSDLNASSHHILPPDEGVSTAKKTKRQKVVSVAKRPLRAVGRFVGKGKKKDGYGSIGDPVDLDDPELLDDNDSSDGDEEHDAPELIGPQKRGSFLERVNSYRSGASAEGGSTTPRRGTLTGVFRSGGGSADSSVGDMVVDQRDWVVFRLERYLRQIAFVLLAFIVGSYHAQWRKLITKMLEYVTVAWVTCCILWIMASTSTPPAASATVRPRRLFASRRSQQTTARSDSDSIVITTKDATGEDASSKGEIDVKGERPTNKDVAATKNAATRKFDATATTAGAAAAAIGGEELKARGSTISSDDELAMLLPKTETETPITESTEREGDKVLRKKASKRLSKKKGSISKSISSIADESDVALNDAIMPHPALNPYYCIDTSSGRRVVPNAKEPYKISNEWFDMDMVVMIRTPDVDDPSHPKGSCDNDLVCDYMKDKARRFEFQYQLKLKKLPEGKKIYFSAELEEPVKMGIIQRAFVGAAMAFIKSTNSSFHYSMAGSKEDPDGRWEKPHMSFPVEMSMDRLVVTKPGETPPTLGTIIHEDPEALKNRKKGGAVDWNLEDTYTMALWTSYVDFLEWRVINLPGIRPFELNKVIGPQPIYLTLYLIPVDRSAEKHYRRDITQVVNLELCNTDSGLLGEYANKWASKTKRQTMSRTRSEDTVTEIDHDDDEQADPEEIDDDDDDDDIDDDDGGASTADQMLGDDTEYDATDAATAAELGEGMYLRSGDSVVLRESGVDDDEADPCFVTNGAGFAVLTEGVSSASTIVLQKARRKNFKSKARNELIKSGDTVTVRLVTKGRSLDEVEIKYLSIHRGWWLKWVSTPPKKNGYFTIITHETEFADQDPDELRASETQSAYLTFGGSFWLRHKRWSHYSVGASVQGSATYGGRVLGLFQPRPGASVSNEMAYNSDEEDFSLVNGKGGKRRVMKTLQLRAYEASQLSMAAGQNIAKTGSEEQPAEETVATDRPKLTFSNEDSHLDVPAWVEVMNRTERIRQLAYVVRVVPSNNEETEPVSESTPSKPFIRLKTGRDLAEVMRVGLSWRSTSAFPPRKPGPTTPVSPQKTHSSSSADAFITPAKGQSSPSAAVSTGTSFRGVPNLSNMDGSFDDLGVDNVSENDEESDDDDETEGPLIEYSEISGAPVNKKQKRRIVGSTIGAIGKVATAGAKVAKAGAKAGVKAGGVVTKAGVGVTKATAAGSKKVVVSSVKTSVKIGKGTVSAGVSAGKAIIGSTSRNKAPPAHEPKSKAGNPRRRRDRDLHMGVNMKKTGKRMGLDHANLFFLAGELAAPEQSFRTVSNVLARMSSVPTSSAYSPKFNNILSTQVVEPSEQDSWFLSGGAMQVGVVPDTKSEVLKGPMVCESLVARCLWESHWREEWCGVYKKGIVFYAPLTQKPCLELSFADVQSIRLLDSSPRSPLPGFPILALETAWQCHYVAFRNDEAREGFREKVEILIPKRSTRDIQITGASERELWKARFWQGFQNSVESDSAVGRGKWAEVQSGSKSISRTILNSRRMDFDLDPDFLKESDGLGKFVENLLSTSLSFSLSSLERDPERLVKFLDAVSHLRLIPIIEIDRDGVDAFCLFVNLYHCLLQHALLLAVSGPLHRRTVANFMRASCYEIGGDVFSLAEIQSCIIRGNMSRPVSPKPPFVDVPKKSHAYRYYALKYTDPRVNFVLNTGDVACPQDIPILRPEKVEEQLSTAAVVFLESQLSVDVIRRCVLLPKVCEVYRYDFDDDASGCLYYCSRYLDSATVNALKRMLREETTLTIKYQSNADQYHTKLILRNDREEKIEEEPNSS